MSCKFFTINWLPDSYKSTYNSSCYISSNAPWRLYQQTENSLSKNFKGLRDFDQPKGGRTREVFLIFHAPTDDTARSIFESLKQVYKETILLTRILKTGSENPKQVHVYCGGDKLIAREDFKFLQYLDAKKVVNQRALWKSMLRNGYSLLLTQKVPRDELAEAKGITRNVKPRKQKKISDAVKKREPSPCEIPFGESEGAKKAKKVNPIAGAVRKTKKEMEALKEILKDKRVQLQKDTDAMIQWEILQKKQKRLLESVKKRRDYF